MTKSLLFLQFQFLLASLRTTIINNNSGGPGPLNLIFANQLKCLARVKLKSFYPKNFYLSSSFNLFMNIMQEPGPDLPYGTVPGPLLRW